MTAADSPDHATSEPSASTSSGTRPAVRDHWGSRVGLILAMAGNAVGLGNFLRFPGLCAKYGGGAFIIPYFVALLLLGIPLMWVEWSFGRYGGQFGYSTTPGMFARVWRHPLAKYLGTLGITLPLLITIYYVYIESWTLAYSYYSLVQPYQKDVEQLDPSVYRNPPVTQRELQAMLDARAQANPTQAATVPLALADWQAAPSLFTELDVNQDGALDEDELKRIRKPLAASPTKRFFDEYVGIAEPGNRKYIPDSRPAWTFWLVTVLLNVLVLGTGISRGIEVLAKIALPALFLFAVVLMIRVLTYSSPTTEFHGDTVWTGLNFIWSPKFEALSDPAVWLAAAGQIFFTLSIGTGSIHCYASYMRKNDDTALTGLTTAMTNEFAEVVLGASIAIPITVATFGVINAQQIAGEGGFNLGFVALPIIFEQMPLGWLFGALWFILLFFAGITSSVALAQPFVAFLQDSFGISRFGAAVVCGAVLLGFGAPVIAFFGNNYLDQMDFWAGTFGLAVFGLLELMLFAWVFGGERMWAEVTRGSQIRLPRFVYYVIRYVAPVYLAGLLFAWWNDSFSSAVLLKGVSEKDYLYMWLSRGAMLAIAGLMVVLTYLSPSLRREGHPELDDPTGSAAA